MVVLVVVQQVVPEGLPREHLGVADDDDGKLGPGESNVQPAGIGEEANSLVLVGPHAGNDDDILWIKQVS